MAPVVLYDHKSHQGAHFVGFPKLNDLNGGELSHC
jgi:hypothetical protein